MRKELDLNTKSMIYDCILIKWPIRMLVYRVKVAIDFPSPFFINFIQVFNNWKGILYYPEFINIGIKGTFHMKVINLH